MAVSRLDEYGRDVRASVNPTASPGRIAREMGPESMLGKTNRSIPEIGIHTPEQAVPHLKTVAPAGNDLVGMKDGDRSDRESSSDLIGAVSQKQEEALLGKGLSRYDSVSIRGPRGFRRRHNRTLETLGSDRRHNRSASAVAVPVTYRLFQLSLVRNVQIRPIERDQISRFERLQDPGNGLAAGADHFGDLLMRVLH